MVGFICTLLQEIEQMIKDAKAGKTVDMDAIPPPVAVQAVQTLPSGPAPSPPATTQATPEVENQGFTQNNKAINADQDTASASYQGMYNK